MTSKDKTREKLVGSMRKTKAVAGIGTDKAETEKAAAAAVMETVVETVAKANTAKPAAKSDGGVVSTSPPARAGVDRYQSGRRVWPD